MASKGVLKHSCMNVGLSLCRLCLIAHYDLSLLRRERYNLPMLWSSLLLSEEMFWQLDLFPEPLDNLVSGAKASCQSVSAPHWVQHPAFFSQLLCSKAAKEMSGPGHIVDCGNPEFSWCERGDSASDIQHRAENGHTRPYFPKWRSVAGKREEAESRTPLVLSFQKPPSLQKLSSKDIFHIQVEDTLCI